MISEFKQKNIILPARLLKKSGTAAEAIAKKNYTIIIHGKPKHEETRATFSHASVNAPSVVVKDMEQTKELAKYITGEKPSAHFMKNSKDNFPKILM